MLDPGEETITEAEWAYAIDFLTRTGRKCDAERQEFVLLSDIPGLDTAAMRELFRTSLDGLSRCAASRLPHTRPCPGSRSWAEASVVSLPAFHTPARHGQLRHGLSDVPGSPVIAEGTVL
jgi:hypothetical protein